MIINHLQQNISLDLCVTRSCCCQLSSGAPHTSCFIILSVILINWSSFSKTGKANRLVMPTSTITAISLNLAFLKLMFSGQTFETLFTKWAILTARPCEPRLSFVFFQTFHLKIPSLIHSSLQLKRDLESPEKHDLRAMN